MRSWPRQSARTSINTGRQSSFYTQLSELQRDTCAHCSWAVLCASPGEGVATSSEVYSFYIFGLDSLTNFGYFLLGALALLGYYLLPGFFSPLRSRCSGMASAYGWVTIVILSMVKRANSNSRHMSCCN
jgi:hypothetical protein